MTNHTVILDQPCQTVTPDTALLQATLGLATRVDTEKENTISAAIKIKALAEQAAESI